MLILSTKVLVKIIPKEELLEYFNVEEEGVIQLNEKKKDLIPLNIKALNVVEKECFV